MVASATFFFAFIVTPLKRLFVFDWPLGYPPRDPHKQGRPPPMGCIGPPPFDDGPILGWVGQMGRPAIDLVGGTAQGHVRGRLVPKKAIRMPAGQTGLG
jgi:hypothetical protein